MDDTTDISDECLDTLTELCIESIIKSSVIKHTAYSFTEEVENLVWMDDIAYIESIEILVTKYAIEPEDIRALITEELYYKLEEEANELSLLKTKSHKKNLF